MARLGRPTRSAFGAQVPRVSSLRLVGYFLALLLALAATTWSVPGSRTDSDRRARDAAVLLRLARAEIAAIRSARGASPTTIALADGAGALMWTYQRQAPDRYRIALRGFEKSMAQDMPPADLSEQEMER